MSRVSMQIRGVNRNVHLEKELTPSRPQVEREFRARTYADSKTVSGVYRQYFSGLRRFYPEGVNAELL